MPEQLSLIPEPPCCVCGAPSEFLCDWHLWHAEPGPDGGDDRRLKPWAKTKSFPTCDVPLCDACRTAQPAITFCGSGGCESWVLDYCPYHVDHDQRLGGVGSREKLLRDHLFIGRAELAQLRERILRENQRIGAEKRRAGLHLV